MFYFEKMFQKLYCPQKDILPTSINVQPANFQLIYILQNSVDF